MHITKLDPGRWRVRASITDSTGRRHQPSGTIEATSRTIKRVAAEWERARRDDIEAAITRTVATSSMTVADVWAALIRSAGPSWSSSHLTTHKAARRHAIADGFGLMAIGEVRADHVHAYLQRFADEPMRGDRARSDSSIASRLKYLRTVIHFAVDTLDVIGRDPTVRMRRPSGRPARDYEPPVPAVLYPALVDATNEVAISGDGRSIMPLVIRIAIATGLRIGEVCGLRTDDLTTDGRGRPVLVINRHVVIEHHDDAPNEWVVKPRTKNGRPRQIAVDPGTVDVIRARQIEVAEQLAEVGLSPFPNAYVVSLDWGQSFISPASIRNWWQKVRAQAGLPELQLHDLRSSNEAELHHAGLDVAAISHRQGHSVEVSLEHYNYLRPGADAAAADHIGRVLDQS
jgi:integrase